MERTQTAPRPRSVPPRLAHARRTSGSPMHTTAARLLGQSQERERGGEPCSILPAFHHSRGDLRAAKSRNRADRARRNDTVGSRSHLDSAVKKDRRRTSSPLLPERPPLVLQDPPTRPRAIAIADRAAPPPPPPPLPPFLPPSLFLAALLPSFLRRSPGTAARVAPLRRLELRRALARSDQDGRRRRFAA